MSDTGQSADPIMACYGLGRSFGGATVLDGLDLEIERAETIVVLGRSGSGKSVLLKHLNGLLKPETGRVLFDGSEIGRLHERELVPMRRRMGMLFQGGALFDSLDVGGNVSFPLEQHDVAFDEARVAHLLELVDLAGTERRMPSELSGGMRKRAALARALALEPEVMLYDEPTTGLDPVTAQQINRLIRSLQSRLGLTSVVVTHDLASADFVADRIAFLYNGKIRAVGSAEEMRRSVDPVIREFMSAGAGPAPAPDA